MKLKLPKLKRYLTNKDIEFCEFWELGEKKKLPSISSETYYSIRVGNDLILEFIFDDYTLGELIGVLKLRDTIMPITLATTECFTYNSVTELKAVYKKCVSQLLKKYKLWVSGFYE